MPIQQIEITNWLQQSWFEKYGFEILTIVITSFIGGLIGYLAAKRMWRLQFQKDINDKKIMTYQLLVAIADEMKRNLDRCWEFIDLNTKKPPKRSPSALFEDAKQSCILDFVKQSEEYKILSPLFSFYENVQLINTHQKKAIDYGLIIKETNIDIPPNAEPSYVMAVNFAMNKYLAMCEQYNKVLEHLFSLGKEVKRKIPDNLKILGESEIKTRKGRIDGLENSTNTNQHIAS